MLATRYLQAGRVADAHAQLEEALRVDPRDAEAQSNLGVVLQAQGRLAEYQRKVKEALLTRALERPALYAASEGGEGGGGGEGSVVRERP